MVLQVRTCGRVGRRRTFLFVRATFGWPLRFFTPAHRGRHWKQDGRLIATSTTAESRTNRSGSGQGGLREPDAGAASAMVDPTATLALTGRTRGVAVGRRGRRDDRRGREARVERTVDQSVYDGPDLPEEITGKELDRSVLDQLPACPRAGGPGRPPPRGRGCVGRRGPGDGVPAHAGCPGACRAGSGRARGRRRDRLCRRPLRRGVGRAQGREADERRHRLPAGDGRLRARAGPARARPGAGRQPVGREASPRRCGSR